MEQGRVDLPVDLGECHRLLAELAAQNAALEQELAAQKARQADAERLATDLRHTCDEQQATIDALQDRLQNAAEQLALLKKALFGRKSERYLHSPDQQTLFDPEPIGEGPALPAAPSAEASPEPKQRRPPRKKFEFPQFLPRKRTELPLPAAELACGCCGRERTIVGRQISQQLEIEPASAYVAETVRCVYGCPHCRDGSQMDIADKPPTINEKGLLGASAMAWVIDEKFSRHVPLYRQQEMLQSISGLWFGRDVLCDSLRRVADGLWPLVALLRERVFLSGYVRADETTLRLLQPGHGQTALCYLWGYAGDLAAPYVTFDFRQDRSRAGPEQLLAGYSGYLQSDGYSVYETLV